MKDVCPDCYICGSQMYLNGDLCYCSYCKVEHRIDNQILKRWRQ